MKLIICANNETLRSIYDDIFEEAGMNDPGDWPDHIADHWAKTFVDNLPTSLDYDYERSFQYWHGGPGSGTWVLQDGDEATDAIVTAACAKATEAARELACAWGLAAMLAAQAED